MKCNFITKTLKIENKLLQNYFYSTFVYSSLPTVTYSTSKKELSRK